MPNELEILRRSRNLSQSEAAERLKISRAMWSSWECKKRQLNVSQLNDIQRELGLTDIEVDRIRRWWDGKYDDGAKIPRRKKAPKIERDTEGTP